MDKRQKPILGDLLQELDYLVDFKSRNLHPGRWPATGIAGDGYSFEKFESLSGHPDFRRIDFLATARNPLISEPLIRRFKRTGLIDVIMLADLSPSISCGFSEPKLFQVAKLAVLFGYTAFRFGDRFGFLGFDNEILPWFTHPPSRSPSLGIEIGERLLDFEPSAKTGKLNLAPEHFLPEKRSLIVLVSDFYFAPDDLRTILQRLRRHAVLPVMLRQEWEQKWPDGLFGVLRLKDPERLGEKVLFFSSRTIKKFNEKARKNREETKRILESFSAVPLIMDKVTPNDFLDALDRRYG